MNSCILPYWLDKAVIHFGCVFLLLSREDLAVTVSLYYPVFSETVHYMSFRVMWPKRWGMPPLFISSPIQIQRNWCLSPMWKRLLSTLTHLQVADNSLKYTCIYIEKIHCTSSQVQSWNMQVFHRDYQDRNHKSVRHSAYGAKAAQVRLTWIRVCHRRRDNLPDLALELIPDTFLNGIPFVFFFLLSFSTTELRRVRGNNLDPLKTHLNLHNVHAERELLMVI